ncbi:MAG: trypsin-like serine protease, partial [Pseudomonadales bacterium]|nr:trypsin-like serine protease [Pseudomonadales bacterium]
MNFKQLYASIALISMTSAAPIAVAADKVAPRIIGGSDVSTTYPWMVSVQNSGGHFCGGALIEPDLVLTAAHCLEGESASGVQVLIGVTELDDTGGERISASELLSHPDYNRSNLDNDIALIKLSSDSTNTPVDLASVSQTNALSENTSLNVIGWGATSYSTLTGASGSPNTLQIVQVPLRTESQCETSVLGEMDTVLCAGQPTGGLDSCAGDSGGPLFRDIGGTIRHLGIVSYGINGCALANEYGVYTRTASYLDWIANNYNGISISSNTNLGYVATSVANSVTLTLENNGSTTVSLFDPTFTNSGDLTFILSSSTCGSTLAANRSCTLTISVTGESTGESSFDNWSMNTSSSVTPSVTAEFILDVIGAVNADDELDNDGNWFTGGDSNWRRSTTSINGGSSMKSGNLDHGESSAFIIDVSNESRATARIKVDSEEDYDGLEIYYDSEFQRFISGDENWEKYTFSDLENVNQIKFVYVKDGSVDEGEDSAWIDRVTFGEESSSSDGGGSSGGRSSGGGGG